MDPSQKFDLIISAVVEARKKHGDFVVLNLAPRMKLPDEELSASEIAKLLPPPSLDSEGRLQGVSRVEVLTLLEDFQRFGRIELSEANYPPKGVDRKIVAIRVGDPKTGEWVSEKLPKGGIAIPDDPALRQRRIILTILPGFDNWLAGYQLQHRDDLESLDPLNLAKVYCTVMDIHEKLQITGLGALKLGVQFAQSSPLLGQNFSPVTYREEALTYLKNKGILQGFIAKSAMDVGYMVVNVNIPKFQAFKPRIVSIHAAKLQELCPPPPEPSSPPPLIEAGKDDDVLYEVRYSAAKEILINEFLLSRLDFDSENDNVFGYIIRHPNKTIGLEDVKSSLGKVDPKKDLSKIIENCGFTRELRKLFFNVSKTAVLFRNPIRRKDLQDLGLERLKLQRR
jgi:hypothetical protein